LRDGRVVIEHAGLPPDRRLPEAPRLDVAGGSTASSVRGESG
jgi:hypothetical protein